MGKTWKAMLTLGTLGLAVAAALIATPSRAATGGVFEVTVKKGQIVLNDVIVNPGVKPPVAKITGAKSQECVRGEGDSFCEEYLENDQGGRFYIYCDDRETWRFGTNPDGLMTTTLEGNLDPTGVFMYAGTHALSGMRILISGKAKLKKGTYEPISLKGTAYFTSRAIQEFGQTTFTAKPLEQ